MIRHLAFTTLLLVALSGPATAATTTAAKLSGTPINVTADQFVVDEATKNATFSGNVIVTRTTLTLWAAKVLVAYGAGGTSDIKSFTASGGVRIKTPDQTATGDQAVFDPTTQILKLAGHVVVTNAAGSVKGPQLVIDLKRNTSVFTGSKNGRVSGTFTPP